MRKKYSLESRLNILKKKSPRIKKRNKKVSSLPRQRGKTRQKTEERLQPSHLRQLLIKYLEGPIISPENGHLWEWHTFNPGAILLEDKVHFLYRAQGNDWLSRLGYAVSDDGFKIDERSLEPVYVHSLITGDLSFVSFSLASGGGFGGCEDPRLVRVNKEDTIYMTYTACDQGMRIVLTSIKVKDFLNKKWRWKSPVFISPPNQIAKNWVLFPEKIKGRYAILHSINPRILVDYFDNLDFDGKTYINSDCHIRPDRPVGGHWSWEKWIRGTGPPPLKTRDGWLVFYHAHDQDSSRYKVGVMLLDLENPTKVLRHSREPILETTELHENVGFKPGIVYVTGAVIKDDNLLIYYGSADSYVCVAYVNLEEFLTALKKEEKPKKLKRKILRTKEILKKIKW